jgi:hypothetical protein
MACFFFNLQAACSLYLRIYTAGSSWETDDKSSWINLKIYEYMRTRTPNAIFPITIPGLVSFFLLVLISLQPVHAEQYTNLEGVEIIFSDNDPGIRAVGEFLAEQIFLRTDIDLPVRKEFEPGATSLIMLGLASDVTVPGNVVLPAKAESYVIWVDSIHHRVPVIKVVGRDSRGVLFGAGKLLQLLYLAPGHISLPGSTYVSSAPADPLRAHQVITNTQCDDKFMAWDEEEDLRKHVNDLVLVGANGFEPTWPWLLDDYLESLGLDLFVKLKCQEIIDLDAKTDQEIMGFFSEYKGIDHITTYGGDASGAVRPDLFFPHMERVLPLIMKAIPGVKWWYSNQCLEDHAKDYDEYIFSYIIENRPPWLYGMVYGPWTKRGIDDVRRDLPSQYELRHFPEICHPRWCQYPVPDWDRAYAAVWPRNQSIYAMPAMMRQIYTATRENTVGALPYNHTGSYNDLNKFVWTCLGWNPEASVDEILRTYAKLFFAHDFTRSPIPGSSAAMDTEIRIDEAVEYVAEALKLLEANWTGPLSRNTSTESALQYWKTIADCVGGAGKNWRVELFLNKAMIDAQVKRKVDFEKRLEREAYEVMRNAGESGNLEKVRKEVTRILERVDREFQPKDEFLEEMKAMGLSDAFGDRDEIVENIYTSFNDRYWIMDRLEVCQSMEDLDAIIHYEDPGPGGFYDNLGVPGEQPHLVGQFEWPVDPGFIHSPIEWVDNDTDPDDRHSKLTHALARYEQPLEMHWNNLDPYADYSMSVVYNGPFDIRIKCMADEAWIVHDFIEKPGSSIVSFSLPYEATSDGELTLKWYQDTTDIMRGVSVSEIWITRNK